MSVCPWCRAEVRDSGAPCRSCGKLAENHPSVATGGRMIAGDFGDDDSGHDHAEVLLTGPSSAGRVPLGVPELELGRRTAISFDDDDDDLGPALEIGSHSAPPSVSRAPARAAVSRPAAPAPTEHGAGGGSVFDDDDMLGGGSGLALELDVTPGPAKLPARMAESIAPSGPPAARGSHRPSSFRAGPTGGSVRPVAGAPPAMESIEARLLGNFGDPPKSWWKTPLYAWRVRARLIELRQALTLRRQDADRARAQTQAALVALGQRARSTAANAPSYGRTLEGIKNAESLLRSRDGALMADMDVHTKKIAVLAQRVSQIEAELAAAQAAERKTAGEVADLQASVQRAESKMKRIEIDLRSAGGAARDPRRGGGT